MEPTTIAIVGGGSVGVSFLAQLVKCLGVRPPTPGAVKILLFEPSATPGAGDAYARDLNTNLLNIPVRNMSAYADDKPHFARWLHTQSTERLAAYSVSEWNEDSFLPRPLFGRYMEEVFELAVRDAAALGIIVEHIRSRVDALHRGDHGQGWSIAAGTERFNVDHATLCNGNLASVAFPELQSTPRYFNCPYPVRTLTDAIAPDDTVAVIGTSLSAVDAIVALKEAGHRGRVLAVSRNGRLPSVRSVLNRRGAGSGITADQIAAMADASGGKLTLCHMADAMRQKIQELGGDVDLEDIVGRDVPAAEQLSHEISVSSSQERLWQVVASSLNDVIDVVWHRLDDTERQTFKQQWRSLWMARRATFPMQNAVKLQRYLHRGDLAVYGGFQTCEFDSAADKYIVHVDMPVGPERLIVDHVVNATSFSLDVSDSGDALIRQLLEAGIAQPDRHGGLRLDYDTGCVIDRNGEIQETLSLLGSLAVGTYFWTLSMDVNARLAMGQAKRLAERVGEVVEHSSP